MIRTTQESPRERQRRIRAEAAVWFARRRGSDRNAAIEEGFRRWLSEDAAHEAQYKVATDIWSDSAQCLRKPTRRGIGRPVLATLAAALVLTIAVLYWMPTTLATGIGEQLRQTLTDGTQVELNTDTHITAHYGAHRREIVLQSGEIYLNVIKHEPRPFVVVAGDRQVVATGTSFMVRRDDSSVTPITVTLIEGCVMIRPTGNRDSSQPPGTYQALMLNAGERARFRRDGTSVVDKPSLEKVTSWKDGELNFSDTPLLEAVREFNRYSLNRITVRSPMAGSIKVNGVFRTEDSLSFIRTVAYAQHMRVQVQGDD